MNNNKQTDIAELAIREYPFSNSERNAFIAGYNKAKEMHKDEVMKFVYSAVRKILDEDRQNPFNLEQYYNETFNNK